MLEAASAALAGPISNMYGGPVESLEVLIGQGRLALKTYAIQVQRF